MRNLQHEKPTIRREDALPATDTYKNDDIELLRAIAVGFILLHHSPDLFVWNDMWRNIFAITSFWGGVDLFFCISGFVIASSLLRETRSGSFIGFAIPFWIKRIWRIWPAALLWALIGILASKFFNRSGVFGDFHSNLMDGIAATMQVANLHFMECWNYDRGVCGKLGIYWSLSLEEQFYTLFPFALFFVPRRWLCLGLLVSVVFQFFLPRPIAGVLWLIRTDAICYGVLIALAQQTVFKDKLFPAFLQGKPAAIAFSLTFVLLMAMTANFTAASFNVGMLAAVCAALVFVASYDRNLILPIRSLNPVLAWMGSRSFAIYLTHLFSYWLTREIFYRLYSGAAFDASFILPFGTVALGFIVLFSELTYRFIETPFRVRGRDIAKRYSPSIELS